MGTSAGPSLQGIGRGGDSNLVLEMDAHDAKSYPGEPTSNIVPNPNFIGGSLTGWSKYTSDVVFTAIADSDNPVNSPYIVKIQKGSGNHDVWAPLINKTFQGGNYTFSAWFKGEGTARLAKYDNNSGYVYGSWVTLTGDWQLTTMNTTFNGSDSTSRCDFFICSSLGGGGGTATPTLYVCGPQCEKKAYATPYVWDGYNGRPATTNLMIHGNVGPDTVAGSNNPNVLSEALSKFETSSGWTVGQDWSINSGTEVAEITSWTEASFLQRAASPAEVIEGGRYVIKGDVTTSNAGTLYARVGNSSYAVLPTGTGSTVEVVCGSTATETVLFYSGGWEGTIDNVSVAPLAVMKDSSPSKHAITTIGDVTHSATKSKFSGGSIYFDASSDYLTLGDSSDWDFGQGDFTVDFWLGDPVDTGIWAEVFSQGWTSGDDSWVIGIDWGSTNKLQFGYTTDGSTDKNTGYTTSQVPTSGWTHYAIVRSSFSGEGSGFTSAIKVYVNGTEEVSYTSGADTIHSSSKPLTIGQRATSIGTFNYNGYMDEVRITKGTALWRGNFTPPTRRNLSAPVVDRSGNDNGINLINGTDSGGETYRVGEVIRPIDTAVLDFDGTDDYAIAGDSDDWNFGTEPFAIEQWLRFTDFTPAGDSWSSSLQQYLVEGDRNGWMVFVYDTQEWRLECSSANAGAGFYPGNIVTGCSLNTWYLFTISREGSIFKQYINGVLRQTDTSNPTFTNIAGPMYIGNYAAGDLHEFQGQMGALRIYKGGALSDEQVKENFYQQRSRFNVPNWSNRDIIQSGLEMWLDAGISESYPGSGTTWSDISGNGYNGTITGATYSAAGHGSLDFNGTTDKVDVSTSTWGAGSFCISMWFKGALPVNYQMLFGGSGYSGGSGIGHYLYSTSISTWIAHGSGAAQLYYGSTLSADTWYNLVFQRDYGVAFNWYLNGQNIHNYSSNYLTTDLSSPNSTIAKHYNTTAYNFDGNIATTDIYTRALSASEIEQNFIVQKQRFGI